MRTALTLCLVAALAVLAGCCGAGGCGVAQAPAASTPATYGSASAPSRVVYERTPKVVVREVARPAPRYERAPGGFTPPEAPAIPAARKVVRRTAAVACKPVKPACPPVEDSRCPGGNCGIPSVDDLCPGGSCAIPSLLDPCK